MRCNQAVLFVVLFFVAQPLKNVYAAASAPKQTPEALAQSSQPSVAQASPTPQPAQTQVSPAPKQSKKESFPRYTWDDLLPDAEKVYPRPPPAAVNHTGTQQAPQERGNVRPELDKKTLQLPGYAVPLKGDNKSITDFLLVPYFGACVHLPPPPTNQVVLVTYPKGVARDVLYDAIWVKGTLHTVEYKHFEGVASSYHISSQDIVEYDFDTDQGY